MSSGPAESPPHSSAALEDLLADARVWRGRQTRAPHLETLPTGWPALDAVLPGGGWPTGALTEILPEHEGLGELGLLLPALVRLTDAGQEDAWVAWVAPPHIPYAPALQSSGVRLERVLVINVERRSGRDEDVQWAAEQTLRSGLCAAVIGWFDRIDDRGLRRLQLAAEEGRALGVAFRRPPVQGQASPAALRLVVRPVGRPAATASLRRDAVTSAPAGGGEPSPEVGSASRAGMLLDVIKCRGGRPVSNIFCPSHPS